MAGKLSSLAILYSGRGFIRGSAAIAREIYGIILKSVLKRRFVSRKIYKFRMILDLNDRGISRTLWLFGQRELDHKWILQQTLKPGSRMLDIGSNIGYYALMEKELIGNLGELIAIEPSPDNVKLLKQNLALNSVTDVRIIEGAVSDHDGQKTFFLAAESNLNSFHETFLEERTGSVSKIDVSVFSLDTIVEKCGEIDYIRMDIEGHEVEVLSGLANLIDCNRVRLPDVIFETHTRAYRDGHDIAPVLKRLFSAGYSAKLVATSSEIGTTLLESHGLPAVHRVRTDDVYRTIHRETPDDVLLNCLTKTGGIRTVYLSAI